MKTVILLVVTALALVACKKEVKQEAAKTEAPVQKAVSSVKK